MDHEPLTPERYRRGGRQMYWVAAGWLGLAAAAMAVAGYGGTHGYSTLTVVSYLVAACLLATMAVWTGVAVRLRRRSGAGPDPDGEHHRTPERGTVGGVNPEPERWTMTDIAAWLTARGRPTKTDTFKHYVRARQAPPPDGRSFGHPWWWPATIREWEAQRPGRGARTDRDAPGFRFWKHSAPARGSGGCDLGHVDL